MWHLLRTKIWCQLKNIKRDQFKFEANEIRRLEVLNVNRMLATFCHRNGKPISAWILIYRSTWKSLRETIWSEHVLNYEHEFGVFFINSCNIEMRKCRSFGEENCGIGKWLEHFSMIAIVSYRIMRLPCCLILSVCLQQFLNQIIENKWKKFERICGIIWFSYFQFSHRIMANFSTEQKTWQCQRIEWESQQAANTWGIQCIKTTTTKKRNENKTTEEHGSNSEVCVRFFHMKS